MMRKMKGGVYDPLTEAATINADPSTLHLSFITHYKYRVISNL